MSGYIIYATHLKPTKKGQFPDIVYEYIADESMVPWHYTTTLKREDAYLFDESEIEYAREIASFWNMKVKQI